MPYTLDDLTEATLRRLYLEERLSESSIADMYGTYQVRVGRLRRKYGIPTLSRSDRMDLPEELPLRLRSILVGSMLGDGSIQRTGPHTARFEEHHSLKQKPYLDWKVREWGDFVSSVVPSNKGRHEGQKLFTHGCRTLWSFWKVFYPEGGG